MNNTLIKGLRLLEELARRRKPMGVSELAAAAGMSKSGAHRLLQALVQENYACQTTNREYALSIKLWELGSAALLGFDLRRKAEVVMEGLMRSTGETVHLSVLDRHEVVYVHKVECETPVRFYTQIGGRAAAHCVATGKAMVAFKSPGWIEDALTVLDPATPNTITSARDFLEELKTVRTQGHACNCGEWRDDVNGLAAPIFDVTGAVIAAIGISGAADKLTRTRMATLAQDVRLSARQLSSDLSAAAPHASLLNVVNHWGTMV